MQKLAASGPGWRPLSKIEESQKNRVGDVGANQLGWKGEIRAQKKGKFHIDNMCTVIAHFYAKPEKVRELEKILQNFVVQTRQEPGCVNYDLHQSDDDPNVFMFYENWRSRQDWDVHNQRPFLKSFLDKRTDYLTKEIEVKTYTMRSEYDKTR